MKWSKLVFLATFLLIAILLGLWQRSYKRQALKSYKNVEAIFIESHIVYNTGRINIFEFQINGKKYETKIYGNFKDLESNDTVLIKYSIDDPTITEMVDPDYIK